MPETSDAQARAPIRDIRIPDTLYRGIREGDPAIKDDGSIVFATDRPEEAAGYGPILATLHVEDARLFAGGFAILRDGREWTDDPGDPELSRRPLRTVRRVWDETFAEVVYDGVHGGSWEALERPEIQAWMRTEGFDGFVCQEGGAETFAFFDHSKVSVVSLGPSYRPWDAPTP